VRACAYTAIARTKRRTIEQGRGTGSTKATQGKAAEREMSWLRGDLGLGRSKGHALRRYNRLYAWQRRRTDERFAEGRREANRLWRKREKGQNWSREYVRSYMANAENRKRQHSLKNKRYRETRKCYACQLYRRHHRMQLIERLVLSGGKWERRMVLWCGC
jgi:hypothetical protein